LHHDDVAAAPVAAEPIALLNAAQYDGCVKRQLVLILLLLLGGAIINVAVAWTLPHFTKATWQNAGPPTVEEIEWWQSTAPGGREVRDAPEGVIRHRGFGWSVAHMIERRGTPSSLICSKKQFGWPMRSLQSTAWQDGSRIVAHRGMSVIMSSAVASEPLWIGTIVNSVLYGVVLLIPWMGIVALRKRRKQRISPAAIGSSAVSGI
jgi:hypothetical protein